MQEGQSGSASPSGERSCSPLTPLSLTDLSKCVRFSDESTLERRQRYKEIKKIVPPPPPPGQESSQSALSSPTDSHLAVGDSWRSSFHAGMDLGQHSLTHQFSLMSQDSRSSISSILSQLAGPDSALSEELYQLSILWVGIWAGINQRRQWLETTQDLWRGFETKKESFCNMLKRLEGKVASFFTALSTARDFSVIQTEITTQKVHTSCSHVFNDIFEYILLASCGLNSYTHRLQMLCIENFLLNIYRHVACSL